MQLQISKKEMRVFKRVIKVFVIKASPLIALCSFLLLVGTVGSYELGNISVWRFVLYFLLNLLILCFAVINIENSFKYSSGNGRRKIRGLKERRENEYV